MAFKESFHCDVCGKAKSEGSEDWWLAWTETMTPLPGDPGQPQVRVTPWQGLLAHSAETKHLCGANCIHTLMDRWMRLRG